MGVVRCCNKLPRGVVDAPCVGKLKVRLDGADLVAYGQTGN